MTHFNLSLPYEKQKLVSLSPKVIERIASLQRAGTKGVQLAGKAEAIIDKLKAGEAWQADQKVAPRTVHGEKRIRKCVKYDLGWGFRLITLLRDDILHICYLGTHDECDRWLAGNSRTKEVEAGGILLYRTGSRPHREELCNNEATFDELNDLDKRLREMPDQTLRRIFSGLVEARRRITQFKRS